MDRTLDREREFVTMRMESDDNFIVNDEWRKGKCCTSIGKTELMSIDSWIDMPDVGVISVCVLECTLSHLRYMVRKYDVASAPAARSLSWIACFSRTDASSTLRIACPTCTSRPITASDKRSGSIAIPLAPMLTHGSLPHTQARVVLLLALLARSEQTS